MKPKYGSKYENIRKLSKAAYYSYYVTIPREYIRQLGWRERQKLVVQLKGESIVVKDWKK